MVEFHRNSMKHLHGLCSPHSTVTVQCYFSLANDSWKGLLNCSICHWCRQNAESHLGSGEGCCGWETPKNHCSLQQQQTMTNSMWWFLVAQSTWERTNSDKLSDCVTSQLSRLEAGEQLMQCAQEWNTTPHSHKMTLRTSCLNSIDAPNVAMVHVLYNNNKCIFLIWVLAKSLGVWGDSSVKKNFFFMSE